ncbi:MAG TPA: EAL domain-containing protein, partial [Burkholderiaceae bacterium]|nr:EAL domain-containing protein [Burkholderiaceae bacterium]
SGVPNRRYFMNELRRALFVVDEPGPAKRPESGYVLLCRQRDLGAMAQSLPRDEVDAWLKGVGSRLAEACEEFFETRLQLARLNGSDFVILMADVATSQAMEIAEKLRNTVLDSRILLDGGNHCRWALAMTDYLQGDELAAVMTRLDTALMTAESAGDDDIELLLRSQQDHSGQRVVGEAAWRELITRALEDDAISLVTELANYGRGIPRRNRYEATLTLHDGGTAMSGYLFMPAAVRLGMSAQLDERAVQLAIIWLQGFEDELVLRISAASVVAPQFVEHITALLGGAQGLDRLIIELDAFAIASHPAESIELLYALRALGVRAGLRGITRQIDVIAQLEGLPLHYVRIGGGFVNQLDSSQGAAALLRAVVHTATALKIQVLADDATGDAVIMMLDDQGVRRRQASEP